MNNNGFSKAGKSMTVDGGFAGGYNSGDWGDGNSGWDNAAPASAGNPQNDAMAVKGVLFLLGALVFIITVPIAVVAVVFYYVMFRWLRYRPSFIAFIGGILSAIGIAIFLESGGFAPLLDGIKSLHVTDANGIMSQLSPVLGLMYQSMTKVALFVSPWIALIAVAMKCNKMTNAPWLVTNEGLNPKWMHNFQYRLSPFEKLKRDETVKKIKDDSLLPYGRKDLVPLGMEDKPLNKPADPLKVKQFQVICRSEDEVPKHTMVTGAAGSGKTVTLKSLMTRDIDNHKTIVVIDCKKDPEVAEFLSRRAKESGCNFYHFSADLPYRIQGNPAGPSSYDPLAHGTISKKVDMILGTREWDTSAAVYRDQAQAYLSKVFATIETARKYGVLDSISNDILDTTKGEMWTFTQMLDRNKFNAVVVAMNKVPGQEAAYIRQQASELNAMLSPSAGRTPEGKAAQHAQEEYLSKMSGLMVQNYGRWLKGGENGGSGKIIDIGELSAKPGNVVLFSLDAAQQGDQGSLIGSMICTDLANMTETRKNLGQDNPVAVYIDEFQSLPPDCVKSMLQKARSAGVGLTLAFQSLDQVSAATGNDTYVKSLLDTCSNFIFHSGSNYDTGLLAAKIIGTHKKNTYMISRRNENKLGAFNFTNDRDYNVGQSEQEEWIVDPSEFAKLAMPNKQNGYKSEAIIIKKASGDPIDDGVVGATSHKVHMIPPDCVLQEYFDPQSPAIDIDVPASIRMDHIMAKDAEMAAKNSSNASPVMYPAESPYQQQFQQTAPVNGQQGMQQPMYGQQPVQGLPMSFAQNAGSMQMPSDMLTPDQQQQRGWEEFRRIRESMSNGNNGSIDTNMGQQQMGGMPVPSMDSAPMPTQQMPVPQSMPTPPSGGNTPQSNGRRNGSVPAQPSSTTKKPTGRKRRPTTPPPTASSYKDKMAERRKVQEKLRGRHDDDDLSFDSL